MMGIHSCSNLCIAGRNNGIRRRKKGNFIAKEATGKTLSLILLRGNLVLNIGLVRVRSGEFFILVIAGEIFGTHIVSHIFYQALNLVKNISKKVTVIVTTNLSVQRYKILGFRC